MPTGSKGMINQLSNTTEGVEMDLTADEIKACLAAVMPSQEKGKHAEKRKINTESGPYVVAAQALQRMIKRKRDKM